MPAAFQGETTSGSDYLAPCMSLWKEKYKKPDRNLFKWILKYYNPSVFWKQVKTGALWEVTSALYSQMKKIKLQRKTSNLRWNTEEEAGSCFGAALLCIGQVAWNLCWAKWNLKTIKAFWSDTHCWVAESSSSIAGHTSSKRINTQLRELMNKKEQKSDGSEVAFSSFDLKSVRLSWNELKLEVWRWNTSNPRELEQFAQDEATKLPVNSYVNR